MQICSSMAAAVRPLLQGRRAAYSQHSLTMALRRFQGAGVTQDRPLALLNCAHGHCGPTFGSRTDWERAREASELICGQSHLFYGGLELRTGGVTQYLP